MQRRPSVMVIQPTQAASISQLFQIGVFGLAVSFGHWQALDPFLSTRAVFGFQDKSAVIGEYLKGFRNVFATWNFDGSNRSDVQSLTYCSSWSLLIALKDFQNVQCQVKGTKGQKSKLTISSLYESLSPERVKYRLFHFLKILHRPPFFSLSWPSITGSCSSTK